MQHLSNGFYILSASYGLSASDTDDYYNNLCNRIWPPLVPHMFEISSGNTFLISASHRTLPLVRYQYIGILLTCFASYLLPQVFCGRILRYTDIPGRYETAVLPLDVPDELYQKSQKREHYYLNFQ